MLDSVKDGLYDQHLDLLLELAELLDRQLESIGSECEGNPHADALGYFDRMEHIVGLGFAACQTYLTATHTWTLASSSSTTTPAPTTEKRHSLAIGPKHASGYTIAELVNHAANYWKHHDEWPLESKSAPRDRILKAFAEAGISDETIQSGYPLATMLHAIAYTATVLSFAPVIAALVVWRDELRHR